MRSPGPGPYPSFWSALNMRCPLQEPRLLLEHRELHHSLQERGRAEKDVPLLFKDTLHSQNLHATFPLTSDGSELGCNGTFSCKRGWEMNPLLPVSRFPATSAVLLPGRRPRIHNQRELGVSAIKRSFPPSPFIDFNPAHARGRDHRIAHAIHTSVCERITY